MAITNELVRLGNTARRLNRGSDQLNRLIERIDELLSGLDVGLDYVFPRPIDETTTADHSGKRVIELFYVGYLRTSQDYHLAIKTVKVIESKLSLANQTPGCVMPLLEAPRRLRYAAVDVLPEVVAGLAEQVDEMVGALERRCQTAQALIQHLEAMGVGVNPDALAEVAQPRRQTLIPDHDPHGGGDPSSGACPGQSSGQWSMMPEHSAVHPSASQSSARLERHTIAMGSDQIKKTES